MPTITLPHGDLHYRTAGPVDAAGPPVVFVHGVLVDGSLWSATADALAAHGVRSFAPDLPLGSHRTPVHPDADQSPRGVARQVITFIDSLGLHDVTLVGNDSGGAICQYVLDTDPSRVGRLVLTNCDSFENFPPPSLRRFMTLLRHPAAIAVAAQGMRSTRIRNGKLGFGPFARSFDPDLTAAWAAPLRRRAIRRDVSRVARAVDPSDLVDVGGRLHRFAGPVRLVWGTADPFFALHQARRLAAAFPHATIVEVPEARTFVPLDAPDRVAAEIVDLNAATGSQRPTATATAMVR